jgi:hypothetical protein
MKRTLSVLSGALFAMGAAVAGCDDAVPHSFEAGADVDLVDAGDAADAPAEDDLAEGDPIELRVPETTDGADTGGDATLDGDAVPDGDAALDRDAAFDGSGPGDVPSPVETSPFALEVGVAFAVRSYGRTGFDGGVDEDAARGVPVQIVDARDEVVAEGITDGDGRATLRGEGVSPVRVRALARLATVASPTEVRDAEGALYAAESTAIDVDRDSVDGDEARDVGTLVVGLDRNAGAFHIVDTVLAAWETMPAFAELEASSLTWRWEEGVAWPCGSCFQGNRVLLGGRADDPDEWDDAIILHEFAHWWVASFSVDDSPGGSHRDRVVTPTLAYGEGLAYFLAGLWAGDAVIIDNFETSARVVDMEAVTVEGGSSEGLEGTSDGTWLGDLREEIVAGVLWDAHDGASGLEPWDALELDLDTHLGILAAMRSRTTPDIGATGIDLADWLAQLVCADTVDASGAASLADENGFPAEEGRLGCVGKGDASPGPIGPLARAPGREVRWGDDRLRVTTGTLRAAHRVDALASTAAGF